MRDASQLPRPDHLGPWPAKLHGYAKKVFSIYSTGFRKVSRLQTAVLSMIERLFTHVNDIDTFLSQVLAIDSDNQPLVNPESLFELQRFTEHGAVFWPDYWKANSAREVGFHRLHSTFPCAVILKTLNSNACVAGTTGEHL